MSAVRIAIVPEECVRVASFIHDRADEHRETAGVLAQLSSAAPLMPPGVGPVVTEAICSANRLLGIQASDLDEQARVLEVAARIIELDQAVAGANWGLAALDAAFAAVMSGAFNAHMTTVEALEMLLASTDVTQFSKNDWMDIAYFKAGIDPSEWDPSKGLLALDEIVQKVYTYYGNLCLENPDFLWAAMANVAGPFFYAAWQDIYVVRHIADDGQRMKYLAELFGFPSLPGFVYDAADLANLGLPPVAALEHLTSEELEWFEKKFLVMQKRIFDDLAWQHEAYTYGGLALIRKLLPDAKDYETVIAWEHIHSGDPERVIQGNQALMDREQRRVIQRDYDQMRAHHGPVGWAFTYGATWMADSPLEDGTSYRDFDGVTVDVVPTFPGGEVRVPLGNVSYEEDRMAWLDGATWPEFVDFAANTENMEATINRPVAERADGFRRLDALPYPR